VSYGDNMFQNLCTNLQILLIVGVSVASCERSFSKLKLIHATHVISTFERCAKFVNTSRRTQQRRTTGLLKLSVTPYVVLQHQKVTVGCPYHKIWATIFSDHITPVLADLHWLPVQYCIQYKLAVIIFKVLTTKQPSYLPDLI